MHMVHLMALRPIISCFVKIQIGLTFLVPAYLKVILENRPLSGFCLNEDIT